MNAQTQDILRAPKDTITDNQRRWKNVSIFLLPPSCERGAVSPLSADQLPGPRRMTHTRGQQKRCEKRDCSSNRRERASSCVTCKWDIIFFLINHSPPQNHNLRGSFVALSVIRNLFNLTHRLGTGIAESCCGFASLGIHPLFCSHCLSLHRVSMPRCWQWGGGCRAASVRKRMRLLCARHSQLPTGCTAKHLSQPGQRMEKGKEWEEKLQSRYTSAAPGWSRYPCSSP